MSYRAACESCAIRHRALCSALPPAGLARINRLSVRKRVPAGRLIGGAQGADDGLATIAAGTVKLVRSLSDGRQQIVALQFPGDFVGAPFGIRSAASAEAATDVELCCLGRAQFEAILAEFPQMQTQLVRHVQAELERARDWMLLLGRKTAEEKIASFFLMLAEREDNLACGMAEATVRHLTLPISRGYMADCLGLTIETVSRQVKRLKDLGIVEFEGQRRVTVPDMAALRRQAELEQD